MKEKHIWIINDYAGSPQYGMTFRHYYLAKEFVRQGFKATIISASYSHFFKNFPDMQGKKYKKEQIDGIEFLWVKTIKYKNSFDKKRILKWLQFAYKLYKIDTILDTKPDYIICSTTAPFAIKPCIKLAKKNHAKLIFEVRDIWPLSLVEIGGYSSKHPFIQWMHRFEKRALNKSDIIVSNLQNYSAHIHNLGINRQAHWVSNGIDLSEKQHVEPLNDRIKELIPKEKFIVGYAGKLGVSNAIKYLVETAHLLKEHEEIQFVIVGSGQEKEKLMEASKGLNNVLFIDTIPKNQIQSMLSHFDVCYIGLNKEHLFTYGVSPNKLFDYMYAEKSIIYAIDSGTTNIIELTNCGKTIEPENKHAIANGILELYNTNKKDLEQMGKRGKDYVL